MIRNFFTIAVRNFLRQRFYSFINILGLASGLICALFIYLWINDETSRDKFHRDGGKIFQVISNLKMNDGKILTWSITPGPLGDEIRQNSTEVEYVSRTQQTGSLLFQYGDKTFLEKGLYADPEFFKIFSFDIISGKPADSVDVSAISISERLAKKLFGDTDPLGKIVNVNQKKDYTVTAVFEDVKSNSSITFDYILPFQVFVLNRGQGFNWGNYDHPLYVKLYDETKAQQTIDNINERRIKAAGQDGTNVEFVIQPFAEYYLNSLYENGKPVGGRIKYVRIFSIVAIFILVIACINFMNMATAKAATRSKEVGIRKVVGAQRKSLVVQFIAESVLISFISMLIAVAVVYLLLPLFNILVGKSIVINFTDPGFLMVLIVIVLVTGLLAGSYPAFFLSAYQPADVLKGSMSHKFTGENLRKLLVVLQFSLTVILIASSLVVYNQINFIMKRDVGYDRNSVITFPLRGNLFQEFNSFSSEAQRIPGVVSIARGDQSVVQVNNQNGSVNWPGKPATSQDFFRTLVVDYGYLETLGLELLEGRVFSKAFNDTSNFVVTKRAVEVMGLIDPLGQEITQWGIKGKIVGVVNDFHSRSMHESIDPIIFMCNGKWGGNVFVKLNEAGGTTALQELEALYKKFNPEFPFVYSYLEDDFEKLYNTEKVTASLALGFTLMAVIISGLGLLALAAYASEKRRKEISIRKTLGASVTGIVSMMSTDFLKLSVVASIIGCPLAYLLMAKFLSGYAYHTDLGWGIFITTAVGTMAFSLVIIIFQVTKAALANPVDALRNE